MNISLLGFFIAIVLFCSLTALQLFGHAVARKNLEDAPVGESRGLGAIEGAVFGLLALLLGFSFSGALSRFEARKELIVAEAVSIGSAWQLVDVVNGPARDELRALMREYAGIRIQIYRAISDPTEMERLVKAANQQQARIWELAIATSKAQGGSAATTALLSSLNEMFDLATARFAAMRTHVPWLIFTLLLAMTLGCSFLAGYSLSHVRQRHWIAILAFSFLMTLTIFVIVDLEFPRMGFIRVDDFDSLLVEAKAAMQ